MAEGLADLGVEASIGEGWGPWAAEVLGDLGLRFDGHLAERVSVAAAPLNRVRQDAAILLHDRGRRPRRGHRPPAALGAGQPRAGRPAAALPHRPAVAGLHLHLRRGLRPALLLAGRPAGGAAGRRPLRAAAGRAAHPGGPSPPSSGPPDAVARREPRGGGCSGCGRRVAGGPAADRAALGRRLSLQWPVLRCRWSGRWWRCGPGARPGSAAAAGRSVPRFAARWGAVVPGDGDRDHGPSLPPLRSWRRTSSGDPPRPRWRGRRGGSPGPATRYVGPGPRRAARPLSVR